MGEGFDDQGYSRTCERHRLLDQLPSPEILCPIGTLTVVWLNSIGYYVFPQVDESWWFHIFPPRVDITDAELEDMVG